MSDEHLSYLRIGPNYAPLRVYRLRAAHRREILKGLCFIVLITAVLFGMLWGLP
jgi:hypothetical protein